jgi:hypothetical protein
VSTSVRFSRGRDTGGACGQLALRDGEAAGRGASSTTRPDGARVGWLGTKMCSLRMGSAPCTNSQVMCVRDGYHDGYVGSVR